VSPVNNDWSDTALLLVAHGSTRNADSAAPLRQHAETLRRGRLFPQVLEAFWKQEPSVTEVIKTISAPRVFIVPLFLSDGYFSAEVIPSGLGFDGGPSPGACRVQRRGQQTLYYCRGLGSHPRMTEVVLARAQEVVVQHPFPRPPSPAGTALLIAGHGTEKNENSRQAVERQVERLAAGRRYAEVHGVFLEEAPRIGDCYGMTAARNLVIVPFFLADGQHTQEDIPVLLGEPRRIVEARRRRGQSAWRNPTERNGKRVWYSPSVGTDPRVAEVILERVREAAAQGTTA
jgi:sirohydrochlorin cobaltochelatase